MRNSVTGSLRYPQVMQSTQSSHMHSMKQRAEHDRKIDDLVS